MFPLQQILQGTALTPFKSGSGRQGTPPPEATQLGGLPRNEETTEFRNSTTCTMSNIPGWKQSLKEGKC